MQSLKIFALGDMKPEGDVDSDDTRFVRSNHTSSLVRVIEGAVQDLVVRGHLPNVDAIKAKAPDEDNGAGIVTSVLRDIEGSDLIIVDVSTESPSVIYELGAVNALGLPYILVSSKDRLPFYLVHSRSILNFTFSDSFNSSDESHLALRNRLLRNYKSPDGREASESVFSFYFGGLPIVNISGPVAVAIGYKTNFLNDFGGQGGILSSSVRMAIPTPGVDEQPEISVNPDYLISFIPNPATFENYDRAVSWVLSEMGKAGLELMEASIVAKDGQKMRRGKGVLALRKNPKVIFDIPRTLYPLMQSPRVLSQIDRVGAGTEELRERLVQRLLLDFRDALTWSINRARADGDGSWRRIVVVTDQDKLVSTVQEKLNS